MARHTSQRRNSSLLLTLVGWSGWAAASSGVLFLVLGYVDREGAPWHLDLAVIVLGIVVPLLFVVGLAGLYVKFGPQAGWFSSVEFLISFAGAGWATIDAMKNAPNLYRQMGERTWSTPPGAAQECGFCLLAKLSQLLSDPITWLLVGLSIVGSPPSEWKYGGIGASCC